MIEIIIAPGKTMIKSGKNFNNPANIKPHRAWLTSRAARMRWVIY